MKSARLPVLRSLAFLAIVLCASYVSTARIFGAAEDQIDNALLVSKSWVAQIDAGNYDDSYAFGCGAMHDRVPQNRWDEVLKALREPCGPVVNRRQISHIYKPNGYEGASGEFLVITYDTQFKKMDAATEVVVLKWEDGKWRGAGYNMGPKPSAASAVEAPPNSTTETHTEDHVKPKPQ